MKVPLANPIIGEEKAKAVYEVVKSEWIKEGEIVSKFESTFTVYSIGVLKGSSDKLMKMLDSAGIRTRIYFPPVHKTPMMKKYGYKADSLKKNEGSCEYDFIAPFFIKAY